MRFLIRQLQRLLILGLGFLTVWLIVFVFELVDRRLPWVLALSLSYGVGAYVILPRAVRMGLKSFSANAYPGSQRQATDCQAIQLILRSLVHSNNFVPRLRPSADQKPISSGWQVRGAWFEHSYSRHRILPPRSARFTFSDVVKTSDFRRRSITTRGSAITYDSGQ
jgi:hypothetical protein